MVACGKHIEIDGKPDVINLTEEISEAGESVVLRLKGIDIAIVRSVSEQIPDMTAATSKTPNKAALMSLAGAWADEDSDSMVDEIYELRTASPRRANKW